MTPRRELAALALTLMVVAAACGTSSLDGDTGTVERNDVFAVTVRPVIGCTPLESGVTVVPTGNPADPASMVVLPIDGQACQLGPTDAAGSVFAGDAVAEQSGGEWMVTVGIRPGADGETPLNVVADKCYQKVAGCASGQMALVIDGIVVMSASVMTPQFTGSLQIAGAYDEQQAKAVALALNHSA